MAKYESSDSVAVPPKLNFTLPTRKEIGKNRSGWSSAEIQSQVWTEILLITANDHEFDACYSYMKHVQRSWHDTLGMVDFGQFGDSVRVALMKCAQGPTEAVIAVKNAADILHPKVILFVGICASMKPTKAKLGDVVISAKLATYGDKKVRADGIVEYRGTKAKVSRYMARLILHAADGWEAPLQDQSSLKVEVHRDAVMLSGPELIDNLERRQELLNHFRDALGLEMEGAGLYAAARDLGIEWAVIKAVSDFGDGSNSETKDWQPFASVMAASVVHNMFKYSDVIKQWPHYSKDDQPVPPAPSNGQSRTQSMPVRRLDACSAPNLRTSILCVRDWVMAISLARF
ncbi:5 -methylthioadenosine S-adenosylhomocysteine nucleosidase-like isoform X16 [Paramuricea clavata]|uniref:5 -methylthioadenosine S-adenosylhomocysteine nucleosidase-like isoform X16 n=1 Tax=Paramuricea clavata TaxID=317549 RepID=A0A6S7JH00_PARCT|nr:5 -methylthioadenosine S-adenosylhomocysteine nucleosidase-like isoform X16 [Paramuricea clavata]